MGNSIKLVILEKYPDYDFDRHSFRFGDVLRTNNGALIFVLSSALLYVEAFILKSSFGFKKNTKMRIDYTDLPYYKKGEFSSEVLDVSKKLKWSVGDLVIDDRSGAKLLLMEERDCGGFYAAILDCDNELYKETTIYIINPYRDYIC